MRLWPASFAASVNFLNDRPTPAHVAVKPTWSVPKKAASAWAAAMLGVVRSGVQVGSGAVAGLPSVSPARIAVTGRQKLYSYLASNPAMKASAPETLSWANSRALSASERLCDAATDRAMSFQIITPALDTPTPAQKKAISVCSGVRVLGVVVPLP